MSDRMQALAKLLPGKNAVEDYTLEELEQLTREFPYFAPAQFLLLQKLKHTDLPRYEQALQKAMLYYHDPLQLEFVLNQEKFFPDLEEVSEEPAENENETEDSELSPAPLEAVSPEEEPVPEEDHASEEEFIPAEEEKESPPLSLAGTLGETSPELTEIEIENAGDVGEERSEEEEEFAADAPPLNVSGALDEEERSHPQQAETPEPKQELPPLRITEIKDRPASEGLTFEPYHTIDFFASQGIKVDAEEKVSDKFGRQVRSFTDWLKVMKRLPASEISKNIDAGAEQKVENMAAQSVGESDVVTEAMAEVWLKQGNRQKAIETYNKLSLLNPSKKAYFAAQIENLKQS